MNKKTALITGSAKRIGKEIAMFLAKQGWNLILHYNESKKEIDKFSNLLYTNYPNIYIDTISIDFENSRNTQAKIRKLYSQYIDSKYNLSLLVLNASYFKNDNIGNFEDELLLEKHLNINLVSQIFLAQEFGSFITKRNNNLDNKTELYSGNIINVTDYCISRMPENFFSYALSRTSLQSALDIMTKKYAPTIRINSIGIGQLMKAYFENDKIYEKRSKNNLLQHASLMEEFLQLIQLFLTNPSLTGEFIHLDSGKRLDNTPYS